MNSSQPFLRCRSDLPFCRTWQEGRDPEEVAVLDAFMSLLAATKAALTEPTQDDFVLMA